MTEELRMTDEHMELVSKRNGTWLPSDVSTELAVWYLTTDTLIYKHPFYKQSELEEYKTKGITPIDLFMWILADNNRSNAVREHRHLKNQEFMSSLSAPHKVKIPKPTKGRKKKFRARRKEINKALHHKANLERDNAYITFSFFDVLIPTGNNLQLLKSYMRYQNVLHGKHITRPMIKDFLRSIDPSDENQLDYCTYEIQKHITQKRYSNQKQQFVYDLIYGRLDHLHIKPGEDLYDYINGNGRFDTEKRTISPKMRDNIQRFKDA